MFKGVASAKTWTKETGQYNPVDPWVRLDVWVFALHTTRQGELYDPADPEPWHFRVIAHRDLLVAKRTSARVGFFEERGIVPVGYDGLRTAVKAARRMNERTVRPADAWWERPLGEA